MSVLVRTPWKLETSEEFGTSITVITGAKGKLHFEHEATGAKFKVDYNYLAAGVSKGFVFNIAESLTTDPSGGFTNVKTTSGSFGPSSFPCVGYLWLGAATAGIFQPSFLSHSGLDLCVAVFGGVPFGGIPFWGRFNSIMPSAGPSVAFCKFSV